MSATALAGTPVLPWVIRLDTLLARRFFGIAFFGEFAVRLFSSLQVPSPDEAEVVRHIVCTLDTFATKRSEGLVPCVPPCPVLLWSSPQLIVDIALCLVRWLVRSHPFPGVALPPHCT